MAAATRKARPVRGSVVLSSAIGRRDSASAPRAHVVSILCVRRRAKVLARAKVLLCDERGRGKPARPAALAVQEGPPSPPARLGPIHGMGRAVRSRAHPLTGLATRARWTDLLPAPIRMAKLGATWLPSSVLAEQVERRRITCAGQTWHSGRPHGRPYLPARKQGVNLHVWRSTCTPNQRLWTRFGASGSPIMLPPIPRACPETVATPE
jgi:hypothetical protein